MRVVSFLLITMYAVLADKVLVLIDNPSVRETHSIFLRSIQDRGHHVVIRAADDSSLSLIKYGENIYDHLLLLAPSVEDFGGSLSTKEISNFVDQGGNVLVAGSSNLGGAIRELAAEHGFEFDTPDSSLIDHHNFDAVLDDGKHTTILADKKQLINSQIIIGDVSKLNPVLFKGAALIASKSNLLKLEILCASSTAYSSKPTKPVVEYPSASGKHALMVGAVQARNNARVLFAGSLEMFSDKFVTALVTKNGLTERPILSGNMAFITDITKWVLKERGVLRVSKSNHHLLGEKDTPAEYTITDDVEYHVDIEERRDGVWQPFLGKDVQLEFVRIDPFVRTTLSNENGHLKATFKLPDVYGVFKFTIDYRRIGYTHLQNIQQISVRPLWHTQYERFIRSAYPYYASSFSMMIGVVAFATVFLHFEDPPKATTTKKSK